MEELKNIDYKGIGGGLPTACLRDLSPSESTISLNGDWQIPSPHQTPECEPHPDTSTTKSTLTIELETQSSEGSSATIHGASLVSSTNGQCLQLSLSPLERYCCHAEAYEQLVVGQITDRQSRTRLSELEDSLDAAARLLAGCTPQFSALSSSIPRSTSGGDPNMIPAFELDPLMMDAPELKAAPREEQAKDLHKIAKLRRRLKAEGSGRVMKSVRVRKRSKTSNKSNETGRGGVGSFEIN
ncbi:hypothetical protein F4824DRAFT_502530 [Ustulina deusta]|nr:hypothetical protein F4824DRAFT_502530 [Ustulina deusta]